MIEDDPGAGLLNLFDLWIAFAVALLLAMIGYYGRTATGADASLNAQLEALRAKGIPVEHYRPTHEELTGQGQRLGIAYRLANGEVVYIPERSR